MKVFLDTNVLLSAVINRGICNQLLRALHARRPRASARYSLDPPSHINCVTSERVTHELSAKLFRKFRWADANVQRIMDALAREFITAEPAPQPVPCPDPSDGWILADALRAQCSYFISGDRVVLGLYAVEQLRIITPREMMLWLHAGVPIPTIEAHEERAAYLARRLDSRA